MSRMAVLVALALVAPARADMMEAYLERTSAQPRCKAAADDEIMVCGRREADKYRVPFASPLQPGDPKTTNVHEERSRLVARESACQQRAALPYGCGMVGVRVSTRLGSGKVEYRPLAP
jgi:hypothetical protein